ncbi:hypothetical protein I204_04198 [Kwoniella mangroviensis CBS 8886]|nr:hypothetical protein I204_04198 [Kwoniella mangroviensis CBS 8886]
MPAIVITALSDPVAIVHIPISLSEVYTTKIYWTIDRSSVESAEFFNITSNRIEMAIFGSLDLITHEWSDISEREKGDILISTSWRVFEISSGDQDEIGNYDSPHLRHVSAPLAKAGISILYQSSYFTDFLLVKESDFEKARNIFTHQGWQIDPSSTPSPRRRSLISPLTPSRPSFPSCSTSPSPARSTSSITPEITVLPSPLACIGFSKSAENKFSERVRKFLVWPERCYAPRPLIDDDDDDLDGTTDGCSLPLPRGRPFISYTKNEDGSSLVTEIEVLKHIFTNDNGEEDGEEYGKSSELIRSDQEELFFQDHEDPQEDEEYHSISDDSTSYHSSDETSHHPPGEETTRRFNGQTFTPPPDTPCPLEYSLPPTPYDRRSFDVSHNINDEANHEHGHDCDDGKSDYSVGEVPIKWLAGKEPSGNSSGNTGGRKRCLQLDLRGVGDFDLADNEEKGAYHLDKSGLVTRFSELLSSSSTNGARNGSRSRPIRMLYSSTFHTANLLVEARDVKRAKRLLERRRRSIEWN